MGPSDGGIASPITSVENRTVKGVPVAVAEYSPTHTW
jgi:hypothetical protein